VTDFNFATARVATGGLIATPADVVQLRLAGVTHIVNCQIETDDAPLLQGSGLFYLWNGCEDDGQPKPIDWFAKTIAFALPALNEPRRKVYLHCAGGINRGPSAAYGLLRAFGLGEAIAEGLIRRARPQVGLAYKHDADVAMTTLGYT
jgi:protein-tyrosine phosphatase